MRYKFGGIVFSKNKNTISHYGFKIIYDPVSKIKTDPFTTIYFGEIFGKTKIDNVVIKIVKDSCKEQSQLKNELSIFMRTEGKEISRFIPKKYAFISNETESILVTENVGPSLEQLLKKVHRLPIQTCLSILYQGIEALQALNNAGFVHNDIKTGNICMSNGNIKLIDFGITWKFAENKYGYQAMQNYINGSPYYVSPEIFYGKKSSPTSRKHDLQSLLYVILELANGTLKWKELHYLKRKQIADLKDVFIVSEIYKIPEPFRNILIKYYNRVWNLKPYQAPDYKKLLK